MTTTQSFALSLEQETLADLESAFAPRVGEGAVFLPGLDEPLVGTRVHVDVTLKGGDVALSLEGLVSWRYPADAVPPGREGGVGILVEKCSDADRALLDRMRAHANAGEGARAPGSRLGSLVWRAERAPHDDEALPSARERALMSDADAEHRHASVLDDGFEIRTADFVLAEHEGRLLVRRRNDDEPAPEVRPLPEPEGYPQGPRPLPELTGLYFSYEYDGGERAGAVKFMEPFTWPDVGTLRPSKNDVRTWAPGTKPPGDLYDDYRSPWDDVTDDQRAPDEVSDPGRRVTDVVNSAVDDMADVEGALAASSARPELRGFDDGDDVEVTETDARGPLTESSEAPLSALPLALRVRLDDGPPEELFAAGLGVPTARTLTAARANGTRSVKVSVLEGDAEGEGRHLGTVRVGLPKGSASVDVRFDMGADGFLEVRSGDDASVRERWRTSWAAPVEYPRPQRRGWLARLLGW